MTLVILLVLGPGLLLQNVQYTLQSWPLSHMPAHMRRHREMQVVMMDVCYLFYLDIAIQSLESKSSCTCPVLSNLHCSDPKYTVFHSLRLSVANVQHDKKGC